MTANVEEFYEDFIDDGRVIDVPAHPPVVASRKDECTERPKNTEEAGNAVPHINYAVLGIVFGLILAAVIISVI